MPGAILQERSDAFLQALDNPQNKTVKEAVQNVPGTVCQVICNLKAQSQEEKNTRWSIEGEMGLTIQAVDDVLGNKMYVDTLVDKLKPTPTKSSDVVDKEGSELRAMANTVVTHHDHENKEV